MLCVKRLFVGVFANYLGRMAIIPAQLGANFPFFSSLKNEMKKGVKVQKQCLIVL